jgi:hypothetical protein
MWAAEYFFYDFIVELSTKISCKSPPVKDPPEYGITHYAVYKLVVQENNGTGRKYRNPTVFLEAK